jgi:DNA polymerase-3 subunit alpha
MLHSDYVPLHVHTQYSLLDGAIRIGDLIEKAVEYKMPAVAITDHGNLFGAVKFYKKAVAAGIRPIIGCEVYVAPGSHTDRDKSGDKALNYHLILLAKDLDGYKNLVTLVSRSYTEGFYYKPRVDKDLLEQYSGGLIALTACLKGEIPYYLQRDMINEAREAALRYRSIFGAENIYIEIQDNGMAEQVALNKKLVELSKDLHMKLVATNDCHYLRQDDAFAHEILLCIQTGKTIHDENRMKFSTDQLYFKSPEEMKRAFVELPESILNTREIAERCNLEFKLDQVLLPQYNIEGGHTPEAHMEKLAREGLHVKIGAAPEQKYLDRFDSELKMIRKMGFSSYFLIVWDFINHARKSGIPVGPGRGSAAGSLIAYCLDITDIDPLKYNLLFERFLNPERISMPDIDVDFCKDRRGEVITYTQEKYGKDHVAQIITFGTMAARAAIRDVGRALGMPYSEVDRVAKLIPATLNITIKEAIEAEPELKKLRDSSPDVKKLIETAMRLEGLNRHASTHAAGVVISPTPLTDYTPLYKNPADDSIITQFDMKSLENIGLLKFDFLGLKTLTVLQKTVGYLKDRGIEINPNSVPLDDAKTYALLGQGLTVGVFQLESAGMKDILVKMLPNTFEDLIALVALYRPGPIGSGMIDEFINRKKGLIPVEYELPQLKEILDETYGVILYQEQVMRIANHVAGFSMGQADFLRRAMGKKKAEEMERMKDLFVDGAVKNGVASKQAVKLFDLMAKFALYGFNKSHSAAYAFIAYQTAYLKAHYAVEFMAANLSSEDTTDKIVKFINECRQMSIKILPPDINLSQRQFTIDAEAIRFGLEAVKGVGVSAIESILTTRKTAPYATLSDFVGRADSRKVNKKVLESLIKAGALDSIAPGRAAAMDDLDYQLGTSRTMPALFAEPVMPAGGFNGGQAEWSEMERLKYEKESLGFYITGHPLNNFERELSSMNILKTSQLEEKSNGAEVRIAGIVTQVKKKPLKDNSGMMAFVTLEDDEGTVEITVFKDLYARYVQTLEKDNLVIVGGRLEVAENGFKMLASEVQDLKAAVSGRFSRVEINLDQPRCNKETFESLKKILAAASGDLPVYLKLCLPDYHTLIKTSYSAKNDTLLFNRIETVTQKGSVALN